jgi:hypothetical protein
MNYVPLWSKKNKKKQKKRKRFTNEPLRFCKTNLWNSTLQVHFTFSVKPRHPKRE